MNVGSMLKFDAVLLVHDDEGTNERIPGTGVVKTLLQQCAIHVTIRP
jgi:hypothetical protein